MTDFDSVSVTIMYATAHGTTRSLAYRLVHDLRARNATVNIIDMGSLYAPYSVPAGKVVYMTSTASAGSHPQAARGFLSWVGALDLKTRPLSEVQFAVFGLGSHTYSTFCAASKQADGYLEAFGGRRLLPAVHADRDELYADSSIYTQWLFDLCTALGILAEPVFGAKRQGSLAVNVYLSPTQCNLTDEQVIPLGYIEGTVKETTTLSKDATGTAVHLYEFICPGLAFNAGDHCSILPRNADAAVDALITGAHVWLDEECNLPARLTDMVVVEQLIPHEHNLVEIATLLPFGRPVTVGELLYQYLDLSAPVSRDLLRSMLPYMRDPEQRKQAADMVTDPTLFSSICKSTKMSISGMFTHFSSLTLPIRAILELCHIMRPRMYSIASAPELVGRNSIQIIVSDVFFAYKTQTGATGRRLGLATGYLSSLNKGESVFLQVCHSPSNLQTQIEPELNPSVLVCLGTGISLCRARLQHRAALFQKYCKDNPDTVVTASELMGQCIAFIGIKRLSDFGSIIHEVEEYARNGTATVFIAVSREDGERVCFGSLSNTSITSTSRPQNKSVTTTSFCIVYRCRVTDMIRSHNGIVRHCISNDKCTIFYCGQAGDAVRDVESALLQTLVHGDMTEQMAKNHWKLMQDNQGIVIEAW